jgi:predicted dehydrogenase
MRRVRELGVAVVGLGVGEQHARAFAALPDCRVRWLLDLDPERAEKLAAQLVGSKVAPDYAFVLGQKDVDVIAIASFDDMHAQQASAALAAGKHVFVEKPLCRSQQELEELKRLWVAAGGRLRLASNLVLRAAPLYRWLKEHISAGALGDLYALDGDYLYGRLHKITEGWRREVVDYSVVQGGGVHLIDLVLWLTGQRPVSVSAAGNRICSRDSGFRYNDFCSATLHFATGLISRITANYGCVHRHQHVLRAFGTAASFIYDDAGARLHESRDPDTKPRPVTESPLPTSKGALIPAFVESILAGENSAREVQTFFDAISVAIACDRAAASGANEAVAYV